MNALRRGVRNAFRNAMRSVGVVVILAVAIALSISMLIARDAVTAKINSVRSTTGTTVTVSPAGFFGFSGGGTPLEQTKVDALLNLPNVVARGAVVSVEKGEDAKIVAALQAAGLPVRADAGEASGLNGVVLSRSGLEWAVDPRREAQALVDHRK